MNCPFCGCWGMINNGFELECTDCGHIIHLESNAEIIIDNDTEEIVK